MTLNECRAELRSIISEIDDIERGIRRDCNGVGEDLCGNCVKKLGDKYRFVLSLLNNVDYNHLASWFIKD